MKLLKKIIDNRYAQLLFFPLAIYNTIQSYRIVKKEHNLLQETINENEEFFKAIATMNFSPDENNQYVLTSIMEVSKIFTIQEIQDIAKETIIKTVLEYVKDESLLGIVILKCDFLENNEKVKITISPAHLDLFENDKLDLEQSIKFSSYCFLALLVGYLSIRYFF